MSRTLQLRPLLGALCALLAASTALGALPNQPALEPAAPDTDHGAYSVRDQAIGESDPAAAIAYDNFSLSSGYNLTGLTWTGIFAEPLPAALSEVDFIVSIWGDDGGAPDIASAPVMQWMLDGGFGGQTGSDVTATATGDVSPSTSTTPGGGPGFDYSAALSGTLAAGDYWISIQADQMFANADPIVDPEWQWHLGAGPDDGFYIEDRAINQELVRTIDKDLAFSLSGSIVPEPSSVVILLAGMVAMTSVRRRRSH